MTGDAIARLIALVEHLQPILDLATARDLRAITEAAQADLDALRQPVRTPQPPTTETRQ